MNFEREKKIFFLINSLISGGAEKVLVNLCKNLSAYFNIYLYTLENIKFYELNKKINYFSFNRKISGMKYFFNLPYLLFKYYKEVKLHKPDLLVSFLEKSNFINILVGRLLKIPVIVSVRINPEKQYRQGLYGYIYKKLIKLLYPKANKIIVVSKKIANILSEKYNITQDKIKVIYNPHDIKTYQYLAKAPLDSKYQQIYKSSFVFINIGRLTKQKGQWFLIRAFKKVVEKYPNVKLIILGDGELKGKLNKLIKKLKLENNVFLLGAQSNPFKFLKYSHCFVLSSLWEGLPNVLIEALSMNLPIISTDCETGPREILCPELDINEEIIYPYYGRYGILIKPFSEKFIWNDINEEPLTKEENLLANLMIKIIENKNLRKKYSNGIKRAKNFDVENILQQWMEIIV